MRRYIAHVLEDTRVSRDVIRQHRRLRPERHCKSRKNERVRVILWIDQREVNRVALDHRQTARYESVDFFSFEHPAPAEILGEKRIRRLKLFREKWNRGHGELAGARTIVRYRRVLRAPDSHECETGEKE